MNTIWEILGIKKTKIESKIKKAYSVQLKLIDRENNPDEFLKLRKAYEEALDYSKKKPKAKSKIISENTLESMHTMDRKLNLTNFADQNLKPINKELKLIDTKTQEIFSQLNHNQPETELLTTWYSFEKILNDSDLNLREKASESFREHFESNFNYSALNPNYFPIEFIEAVSKFFDWNFSSSRFNQELKDRSVARRIRLALEKEIETEKRLKPLLDSSIDQYNPIKLDSLSVGMIQNKIREIMKKSPEFFRYELTNDNLDYWQYYSSEDTEKVSHLQSIFKYIFFISAGITNISFVGILLQFFSPELHSNTVSRYLQNILIGTGIFSTFGYLSKEIRFRYWSMFSNFLNEPIQNKMLILSSLLIFYIGLFNWNSFKGENFYYSNFYSIIAFFSLTISYQLILLLYSFFRGVLHYLIDVNFPEMNYFFWLGLYFITIALPLSGYSSLWIFDIFRTVLIVVGFYSFFYSEGESYLSNRFNEAYLYIPILTYFNYLLFGYTLTQLFFNAILFYIAVAGFPKLTGKLKSRYFDLIPFVYGVCGIILCFFSRQLSSIPIGINLFFLFGILLCFQINFLVFFAIVSTALISFFSGQDFKDLINLVLMLGLTLYSGLKLLYRNNSKIVSFIESILTRY